MNNPIVTVALVEDIDDIRDGLAALINGSHGFRCLETYANAEDALRCIPLLKPDVTLMDINLPGMSGIACTRALKSKIPDMQIVVLTAYENDTQVFESLKAGASGYLLKKTPPVKLLEAIEDVVKGGSPMSSQIARKVVQTFHSVGAFSKEVETLTIREQEILSYLAKGYRYKEIADTLFISVETVRTHLRNIYEKLHVRSRTEAVLKVFLK